MNHNCFVQTKIESNWEIDFFKSTPISRPEVEDFACAYTGHPVGYRNYLQSLAKCKDIQLNHGAATNCF